MIYLAQTDTTAGFLSQNLAKLNKIKGRKETQPCIITLSNLANLKNFTRVPQNFKNLARRAKKTTIIYPNHRSFRVVKDKRHLEFLKTLGWAYSSSANLHNHKFDEIWAKSVADIVIDDNLSQNKASTILKISKTRARKIR